MEERTFAVELTYNEALTLIRVLTLQEGDDPLDMYEKELAQDLATELTKVIGGL